MMNIELLSHYLNPNIEKYKLLTDNLKYLDIPYIIAGGAARQIFLGEEFGSTDVDIYIESMTDFEWSEFKYKLKKNGWIYIRNSPYAFTFNKEEVGIPLQIVHKSPFGVEGVFKDFDFTCCQFAVYNGCMYYMDEAKEDAQNKHLRLNKEQEGCKAYRLIKYIFRKGYIPFDDYTKDKFEKILSALIGLNTWHLEIDDIIEGDIHPSFLENLMFDKPLEDDIFRF